MLLKDGQLQFVLIELSRLFSSILPHNVLQKSSLKVNVPWINVARLEQCKEGANYLRNVVDRRCF